MYCLLEDQSGGLILQQVRCLLGESVILYLSLGCSNLGMPNGRLEADTQAGLRQTLGP